MAGNLHSSNKNLAMRLLLTSLFIMLLGVGSITAQETTADHIANLIRSGNTNELSKHFMNNIDLTILNTDDVYSRAQAAQITRRFFDEHTPTGFTINHQGKSKLDDHYRIGTLTTENGNFRVTYFIKNTDGKFLIKQLRIESNNRDF